MEKGVYGELDEAKDEIEKLKSECRLKAELSERLKKSHNDLLGRMQEASLKIEKLTHELNEKADEACLAKEMCKDLESSLVEKESIIKRLSAANDKLRSDLDEKFRKWEEDKRGMVLALDEADEKNIARDKIIHAFEEEIVRLKECLSLSRKKCTEAEKKTEVAKELREKDDILLNIDEEKRKVQDQLKWKKEQFKHLEEAHKKLQDDFRTSKWEWEQEISTLIDKLCAMETRLDSQTRISEDLQSRLQMCNQALAHEESRRKYLEVQVSEFQTNFESVFAECQDAKSKVEYLTAQRDKEFAALRTSLGTKETLYKEMEYQAGRLERENQELLMSLKELREVGIHEAGNKSSLGKLRSKFKSLEQTHRTCEAKLSAKEAEWSGQLEKVTRDLNDCRSEIERKDAVIQQLKTELEDSSMVQLKMQTDCRLDIQSKDAIVQHLKMELEDSYSSRDLNDFRSQIQSKDAFRSQIQSKDAVIRQLEMELEDCYSSMLKLKLENEEVSVMSLVLRAWISEARLKLARDDAKMHILEREREENVAQLMVQLEIKTAALLKAETDINEERNKAASLMTRIETLGLIEEQQLLMQKELEQYKEMLEDSSRSQISLKQHVSQMERESNDRLRELSDALDRVNSELDEQICEGSEIEFEMQTWKSVAERLRVDLEENHEMRKQLEASLLLQVEAEEKFKQDKDCLTHTLNEKDRRINALQEQIVTLEKKLETRESEATTNSARMETAMMVIESEKDNFLETTKEKDEKLEDLQEEIELLEQESLRRELEGALLAQIGAERIVEQEKENLIQTVNSLEQNFNSSLASFSSQLAKKQAEINLVHEAWEKIVAADILAEHKIEEKKLMIIELEDDIHNVQQNFEAKDKLLSSSKEQVLKIEAELEAKQLEMDKLAAQMKIKLRNSEALIDELKNEKINLLKDVMKLQTERESLLGFVGEMGNRICKLSSDDMQLMGTLERIVQSFDDNISTKDSKWNDGDSVKENGDKPRYPQLKKLDTICDGRSPFRELNT